MNASNDFEPEDTSFLPVAVRRVLYVVGLAAAVVAPILGVEFPEYRDAIMSGGIILQAAAFGTAIANVNAKTDGKG
mgnify:FL=1